VLKQSDGETAMPDRVLEKPDEFNRRLRDALKEFAIKK
jgi:hypothetical protein